MTILIRRSSLIFLLALAFSYFQPTIERTVFGEGKNFVHFERGDCRNHAPHKVANLTCRVKYIDRNNLKGYLAAELLQPIHAAWIHGIGYYKYNTYQKIATEYWDDLCSWIAGKRKSYLLDFLKPLINKYTNANHSCPYTGLLFAKADNISAQKFVIPQIIPAGRYKVEGYVTEGDRKTILGSFTFYGSVSDHRIEVI